MKIKNDVEEAKKVYELTNKILLRLNIRRNKIERLIENNKNKFDELSIKLENIESINSEDLNKISNAALKFKNMNKEDNIYYHRRAA